MRIVPAMELRDRLRIDIAGPGLHQYALFEMRLELALQRDEERRAVVTMPVGVAARHDLGVVDLHFDLRVPWDRGVELVEQQVAEEIVPRRNEAVELELEILVSVACRVHAIPPC